jgi:hypothetical protein
MQEIINNIKKIPDKYINIFSFLLIVSSLLFLSSPYLFITNFWIAIFITNIVFWLEGRFSFFFALIFLLCTMFSVATKDDKLAENFAILVYYLLVTGVFIEFLQMGIENLNNKYNLLSKAENLGSKASSKSKNVIVNNVNKIFVKIVKHLKEITKYRIMIYKKDE